MTRKITDAVARIACGSDELLKLGNLDALRDWGHAKDYVEAMWLMLQQQYPEDFVIATGKTISVRRFVELAFSIVDIDLDWSGSGIDEIAVCAKSGRKLVTVDSMYFRPAEVELLHGDPTKAVEKLGWRPSYSVEDLAQDMVSTAIAEMKS